MTNPMTPEELKACRERAEAATPPVASLEIVPERRTVAGCVHEYPPGCPEGTTRCWLCGEADALPPRGPYTSPKPSRTSEPG